MGNRRVPSIDISQYEWDSRPLHSFPRVFTTSIRTSDKKGGRTRTTVISRPDNARCSEDIGGNSAA